MFVFRPANPELAQRAVHAVARLNPRSQRKR